MLKCLDCAMFTTQSFFFFFEDRELPIIPLQNVTLLDHYPIFLTFSWKNVVQRSFIMQFVLNMLVLTHNFTICHILCVWNFEL